MSALHSVHADLLDPVGATITALQSRKPARMEAAEILVDAVHEFLKVGGPGVATLRLEGLTREEWHEVDGVHVNGWKKRVEMRTAAGALIAAVEYETDEGWAS